MYDTIQRTIVAWAFNHYIAYYYFDNINVNQLKVAFEKGEVELENLPIKKDALKHLNLPMEVISGVVGKLSVKVPIMTLLKDPWTIQIRDIMLIVAPKQKLSPNSETKKQTDHTSTPKSSKLDFSSPLNAKEHLDTLLQHETGDTSLADYLDNTSLDDVPVCDDVNSVETKTLLEFYSSFSASVSTTVRDIYKNIKLEIESMTILFEDVDHGLVKLSLDSLLLHRPKSVRNLIVDNINLYLSNAGPPSFGAGNDLLHIHIEKCNMDIFDESSNNMQLVVLPQPSESCPTKPNSSVINSETKCEGNLKNVSMEEMLISEKRSGVRSFASSTEPDNIASNQPTLKRSILNCDLMRVEFKLSRNVDEESIKSKEKNLQMKFDMVGMRYIHSQRIYDLTTQRLKNLLKFILGLNQPIERRKVPNLKGDSHDDESYVIGNAQDTSFNRLLIFNIIEGLVYIVDDSSCSSAIPTLELSLDDCRILQFSGEHQQNGFVFAKVGCNHFNRETSSWETFLHSWPFNLSWDFKSGSSNTVRAKRTQHRVISLTSDETANFTLSSSFIDLYDVALKEILVELMNPKHSALATRWTQELQTSSHNFNSLFVIHNETGHRLFFSPLEQNSDIFEIHSSSNSFIVSGSCSDSINHTAVHKMSIQSQTSSSSRDSPDHIVARWLSVEPGEYLPFEYETLPVYRRHMGDSRSQSRILLIRVEGWKTLLPVVLDRTGSFFREAYSDRVVNEDTGIAVYIDLEEGSARKIISIRSPLNLINMLDSTLEVHFEEAKQALYIKPNSHLPVPLPFLHDTMRVRPCNVGVTMSEDGLTWDEISEGLDTTSKIHICHPISVTNHRHASYSNSQPYRICVSARREESSDCDLENSPRVPISVFTVTFNPPLTIVNLLPCSLRCSIGDVVVSLDMGKEEKINYIDTTRANEIHFTLDGFPRSKPINIDPGATGNFYQIIELLDKKNRSLYLRAKVIISSCGEEPATQVLVYAPYWFINKTGLPLIFKQEGAALEAAGQYRDHEEAVRPILLFSFYDIELEPPWLCSMRVGQFEGFPMWCEGFKLEKGSGERRLHYIQKSRGMEPKRMKSLIDIDIRQGYGRYSETVVVSFSVRYGFDPNTKTPQKGPVPSPHNYKLTSYNHNTNLAERIAGRAVNLFGTSSHKSPYDINIVLPGFKLGLVDSSHEKLVDVSVNDMTLKCSTKSKEQILDCTIQDIRIENALPDCENSIMLDRVSQPDSSSQQNLKPAMRLIMDRVLGSSFGATLFRQVQLSSCEFLLNIEEKLFLKLVEFMSVGRKRKRNTSNLARDLDKNLQPEGGRRSKYYFDLLRIDLTSLQLSVFTSTNLPDSLQKLKTRFGLKFFSFEDAKLHLSPYFKMNLSKTFRGVFESVTRFYKKQIFEQAPRIVGQQIQNYLRFHLSDLLSTLYDEVYNKLFN